jgi:hypothetical protein
LKGDQIFKLNFLFELNGKGLFKVLTKFCANFDHLALTKMNELKPKEFFFSKRPFFGLNPTQQRTGQILNENVTDT